LASPGALDFVQTLLRSEMDRAKTMFETKLGVTLEELDARCKEITTLREKVKRTEAEAELKGATASSNQEQLLALQNQLEQNRIQYEGHPGIP